MKRIIPKVEEEFRVSFDEGLILNWKDILAFIGFLAMICFILYLFIGCSKPESNNCNCEGQFVNIETAEYIHQPTDCNRVPPDGYVFVKCLGEPEY